MLIVSAAAHQPALVGNSRTMRPFSRGRGPCDRGAGWWMGRYGEQRGGCLPGCTPCRSWSCWTWFPSSVRTSPRAGAVVRDGLGTWSSSPRHKVARYCGGRSETSPRLTAAERSARSSFSMATVSADSLAGRPSDSATPRPAGEAGLTGNREPAKRCWGGRCLALDTAKRNLTKSVVKATRTKHLPYSRARSCAAN
jgi:hypothetical protein